MRRRYVAAFINLICNQGSFVMFHVRRMVDVGLYFKMQISQEYWKDLCVGDIVWIKKGQEVPADLVQLSSSDDKALDSLNFFPAASLFCY